MRKPPPPPAYLRTPSPIVLVAAPRHDRDPVLDSMPFPALTMGKPMPTGLFCHYCMQEATTRDHIVPKKRHGVNAYFNLVPACEDCNTKRGYSPSGCTCAFCERARWLYDMGHRRHPQVVSGK